MCALHPTSPNVNTLRNESQLISTIQIKIGTYR